MTDERWVAGDGTGLLIPADAQALRDGGADFLTESFRAFGALTRDNRVIGVTRCEEVAGGSTGRKLLLSVDYESPAPHRDLFVKFSRDLDDPERDHGRTQMEPEIAFASLSRADDFPVRVPYVLFADYHRDSGTGVLITERIPFGTNGIERQYHKCMDSDMPDQVGHYRALLGAVARLAGTEAAGTLPNQLGADMEELSVGERPPLTAARLHRRIDRLSDFAAAFPMLLPTNVRSPEFLSRLRTDLPRLLDGEAAVWKALRAHADSIALCHWNANVDNAWFWTRAGALHCGLMDWGSAGRMNVAMAVWGAMCSAETDLWDDHAMALLAHFAEEFRGCGGAALAAEAIYRDVLLYAAIMGMTWLLDVPAYVRAQVPDLDASSTRMDPDIRNAESVRCRLQMMTNVLNLLERNDIGRLLDGIL